MNTKRILRKSLKSRVTLFTLLIFVLSMLFLLGVGSRVLEKEMEIHEGQQQLATVDMIARSVNEKMEERVQALSIFASHINPDLRRSQKELESYVLARPVFQKLFTAGFIITNANANSVAAYPYAPERIGVTLSDKEHITDAIKNRKIRFGEPIISRVLHNPIFSIVVPIVSKDKVIGSLVGITDLSKTHFFDIFNTQDLVSPGSYLLLVNREHRQIVMSTDESRIMTYLPAKGLNSAIDRNLDGSEGTSILSNVQGVKVMSSSKTIPVNNWYVVQAAPLTTIFAPVYAMQKGMLLVTLGLILVVGSLTWWMLHRQLTPLKTTADLLGQFSGGAAQFKPLPVKAQDEIGNLVGGFNQLLSNLDLQSAELNKSESRWKFAIEGAGFGLFDWDIEKSTVFYSPRWKAMLGYEVSDIGNGLEEWSNRVHPDDLESVKEVMQKSMAHDSGIYFSEHRLRAKNGDWRWGVSRGLIVSRDDSGKPLRMIGTFSDITEEKNNLLKLQKSEINLVDKTQRLENVSRQLVTAQEAERSRVAIELHDELGQSLTAIKINLQMFARQLPKDANDPSAECIRIVDVALQQVRSMVLALRPAVLDDLGLQPALRWLTEQSSSRLGLSVVFTTKLPPNRYNKEVETTYFRVAQEALTNISRYAQAQHVFVELKQDGQLLELLVQDDGVGYDLSDAHARAMAGGSLGVLGMRERARLLGGELLIETSPGNGCTVRLSYLLNSNGAMA